MYGDVKRIRFHLMGLAIVIITLLQLLLIALNRVAIIENEWKRLENYAWNVKVKSIDYNVKGGKTIISIDKNKADMMQSEEADGVSLGIVQRKEKYNETLFDGFDAKDKQKKFLTENLSGKRAWQMTGIFLSCISRCTA